LWALIQSGKPPKKQVFVEAPFWAKIYCKIMNRNIRRYYRWADKNLLSAPSIFDQYRSIVVNFPMYNWKMPDIYRKYGIPQAVKDLRKSEVLFRDTFNFDRKNYIKLLQLLKNSRVHILALWIYVIDVLNHLFPKNIIIRLKYYTMINTWIQKLLEEAPEAILIVLSDHGGRNGVHTSDAVISVNRHVKLPQTIDEVYDWLRELLQNF